jgi:hypothetical protein
MGGEVRRDLEFAGQHAVALGVGVAEAVAVFGGYLAIGAFHRFDHLADELVFVGERLFEFSRVLHIGA